MEIAIIGALVLVALVAVLVPAVRGGGGSASALADDADIENEIARYREALRADTMCRRCGQANPADAKYCYECGRKLPVLDREEFEGTEAA